MDMQNSDGTTQNTLFTGDNLYILRGINSQSVDLIYLDPPFNSKRTYSAPMGSKAQGTSFKDMWSWDDINEAYLELLIKDSPDLVDLIQVSGRVHSKAMMAYLTYMTQRIIEMHRILKDTGSFYLHCDPTASHYLKQLLDYIFKRDNFKNEIVWKRKTSVGSTNSIGRAHDIILHYVKNKDIYKYCNLYSQYNEDYVNTQYRYEDEKGRYRIHDLVANKALSGGGVHYTYKNYTPERGWLMSKEKLLQFENNNMIVWSKNGVPRRKIYLDENKGNIIDDTWIDINIASGKERTGYPTQKPLELMHRIIKASCPEGGVVLDPFCGCATTCVAAQQLGRKWIGIDIEEKAAELLIERLSDDAGLFQDFIHRTDTPMRTDVKYTQPTDKDVKDLLYKDQKGHCNGCQQYFEIRHFEVDHIVPKSKGGGNYYENYQLLCSSCNRIKGNRPMEYLRMKIEAIKNLLKHKLKFGE